MEKPTKNGWEMNKEENKKIEGNKRLFCFRLLLFLDIIYFIFAKFKNL